MNELTHEAARAVAFRFLGYSARSCSEIERRLARDGYDAGVIAAVISELEDSGYLDDGRFAKEWVNDRADRKMYGKARLAAELRRKGVSEDAADAALESGDSVAELRRAQEAARRRIGSSSIESLSRDEFQSEKRRLAAFLQRRGFAWEIITKVMAELMPNSH